MFDKNLWYFLHAAMLLVCIVSIPTLGFGGLIVCTIGYFINLRLRERCLGFYYGRREDFGVDVIDTEWEPVTKMKKE